MSERIVSTFGALVMLALAYALCPRDRRKLVRLRSVGIGVVLLVAIAAVVLRTPANRLFAIANTAVERLLGMTRQGATFVFGNLVTDPKTFGYIFAFQVLPTI